MGGGGRIRFKAGGLGWRWGVGVVVGFFFLSVSLSSVRGVELSA